ncbi:MAG: hypothetical protein JXR97_15330 [Planctomycetes bacterium]|nr:hypothetical protein [Planctomycetota bacterium]
MSAQQKNKVVFFAAMAALISIGVYIAAFGRPSWMGKMEPYRVAVAKCK